MTTFKLKWDRWSLELGPRTLLMGVVNITPDSFSDSGRFYDSKKAIAHGLELVKAGADIIDIGGESTRPGAEPVSLDEELERIIPVIEGLNGQINVPISVDTYKSEVAKEALKAGASMLNDISAGRFDPEMVRLAAKENVPLILMHMKGQPRTMQENPIYRNLMAEVKSFLSEAADKAEKAGVAREMIIIDPGVGFGKTFDHNLVLLNRLEEFAALNRPLLVGPSRKAFLGQILGGAPPEERETATVAAAVLASYKGAHIIRVHKVEPSKEALAVVQAVRREHTA